MAEMDHLEEARIQLHRAKQEPIEARKDRHIQYAQLHADIAAAEELRAIRDRLDRLTAPAPVRGVGSDSLVLRVEEISHA